MHQSHKGSAKVAGLQRRIQKEKSWLETLSVRHDDPDAVLDDNGKPVSVWAAAKIPDVSFARNGVEVATDLVLGSLDVISDCRSKLSRLVGK
jgi:hypothetical protein